MFTGLNDRITNRVKHLTQRQQKETEKSERQSGRSLLLGRRSFRFLRRGGCVGGLVVAVGAIVIVVTLTTLSLLSTATTTAASAVAFATEATASVSARSVALLRSFGSALLIRLFPELRFLIALDDPSGDVLVGNGQFALSSRQDLLQHLLGCVGHIQSHPSLNLPFAHHPQPRDETLPRHRPC